MAIQTVQLKRVFLYSGIEILDPNPTLALDAVKAIIAMMYPEVLNMSLEGPEIKGDKSVYSLHKAAGAKG